MDIKRYPVPAKEVRTEIIVQNSHFITTIAHACSVEEARTFVARVRAEFPDASHHVPAFLIGFGSSVIAHSSDDGEPSGTAGRPTLTVLQGSGLGDVVVVVTRFFGGIKLGTGGLVRAYGDAVKDVLSNTPRAEKIPTYTVMTAFAYNYFDRFRLLMSKHQGQILDEDFAVDVTVTARLTLERFPAFQADLSELTRGEVRAEIIETNYDSIFPISTFPADR